MRKYFYGSILKIWIHIFTVMCISRPPNSVRIALALDSLLGSNSHKNSAIYFFWCWVYQ